MDRAFRAIVVAALASSGCGNELARPRLTPDELLAKLRDLPGVTVDEESTEQPDLHYYILHFTQPLDHDRPDRETFQQRVGLLHRNEQDPVPMIVHTSGYDDYYKDTPVELTRLLAANQVSIEHRFFGESRPADPDWSKLTIEQMAADEHDIITALRTIYGGAFVTTGGSKGGAAAVFHRRFYPDDADGTIGYVAPISFSLADNRYPRYVEDIGEPACREAVRHLATLMLDTVHRPVIEARAQAQAQDQAGQPVHLYTRVEIGPAVEAAVASLEWTFWQVFGVDRCVDVPRRVDDQEPSDDQMFEFLNMISPVTDNDDDAVARFAPYYYQAYSQLGFPDYGSIYLSPYLDYTDLDYIHELPTPLEPVFHEHAMLDIDDWVEHHASRIALVYGEWDPWTAGRIALGLADDSKSYIVTHGTHHSEIIGLDNDDREDVLGKLRRWTGVTPLLSRLSRAQKVRSAGADLNGVQSPAEQVPRVPPVVVRALRGLHNLSERDDLPSAAK
jgi:hypothetical protein